MRSLAFLLLATSLVAAPLTPSNYDENKVVNHPLPDPLVCDDGTPVRDVETWRKRRRPELLKHFATEIYGRTRQGRPQAMRWETTSVDRAALGGKATRREITVFFDGTAEGPKMHLLIYQPNGNDAPRPAFLGLNFFGNHAVNRDPGITLSRAWMRTSPDHGIVNYRATEASRGTEASRWNIETVIARGYATATIYYGDLCPDNNEGLRAPVGAMLKSGSAMGRPPDGWGSIGLWAWGLSRALDVLEHVPEIDAKRIALHGHSRLGKTALWAAAQDERFAMAISNNSGCGGAALSKRIYGETVATLNANYLPWFALNFRKYDDNEAALPVDQHQLLALIAPRPLYVASASLDRGADPRGEFLGLKHAEPVYRLFGDAGLGATDFPPVNTPIGRGALGYHLRAGKHEISAYDWAQYLDFADRHFNPRR